MRQGGFNCQLARTKYASSWPRLVTWQQEGRRGISTMGMLIVERRLFKSLEFGCGRPKKKGPRDIAKGAARYFELSLLRRALPVIVISSKSMMPHQSRL